jgi:conjugal transfer pilus assembly protein TraB
VSTICRPTASPSAKVIVGVDASAGVNSQTDPLAGRAARDGPGTQRLQNGRLLTTKIEGCLINGAARGDLSSEKVYVKLQKMTCPQPGGRYAVSEVKGFIAFGGKTGCAAGQPRRLAGHAGVSCRPRRGWRQRFSTTPFSQPGTNISTDGQARQPHAELGRVGLRRSAAVPRTGKDVSKYLIERAEQYQPVIEMPTGIDVEIVFLEGVYVRN